MRFCAGTNQVPDERRENDVMAHDFTCPISPSENVMIPFSGTAPLLLLYPVDTFTDGRYEKYLMCM